MGRSINLLTPVLHRQLPLLCTISLPTSFFLYILARLMYTLTQVKKNNSLIPESERKKKSSSSSSCVAGKIRGIIPYQPAFRKFDVVEGPLEMADEGAALISGNCPQCETRQVRSKLRGSTQDFFCETYSTRSTGWSKNAHPTLHTCQCKRFIGISLPCLIN